MKEVYVTEFNITKTNHELVVEALQFLGSSADFVIGECSYAHEDVLAAARVYDALQEVGVTATLRVVNNPVKSLSTTAPAVADVDEEAVALDTLAGELRQLRASLPREFVTALDELCGTVDNPQSTYVEAVVATVAVMKLVQGMVAAQPVLAKKDKWCTCTGACAFADDK